MGETGSRFQLGGTDEPCRALLSGFEVFVGQLEKWKGLTVRADLGR
jgi:hypothetical protein